VREFVQCRRDRMWGEKSVTLLISLFLNPENKILGGEALGADEATDNETTGLDMAKKLIHVIPRD
jgi:hypothetical protein